MSSFPVITEEFVYIALIFSLFVIPKLFERLRLPAGVVALLLGVVASLGFNLFAGDRTISLLATFGVTALFLFAGLEVELDDLKRGSKVIVQHILWRFFLLFLTTFVLQGIFSLDTRSAGLFALALITPSTGFILDSIGQFGLTDEQKFWVKAKAISVEIVALFVMFVAIQSATSVTQLAYSSAAVLAIVLFLPVVFKIFAKLIAPYAPNSEFAFFIMLAILCGMLTKKLGAYYLVGAFLVGFAVQRFKNLFPDMESDKTLYSIRLFTTFFVPFYFFKAGLEISSSALSWRSLGIALALVVCVTPLRILSVVIHRRFTLGETLKDSIPVAVSLLPTLVFGLVIAQILHDPMGPFKVSEEIFGAIVIYTILLTLVPGFYLKGDSARDIFKPLYDMRRKERSSE